ncbi:MAG: 3-phosphoshikimate 1-carboxyvinyltransferase [Verrucomicrobia subdivision 3 bacterium]|nr:3-phosphoshikimate 1-carboxyvinyltransferase [Limisphaerales bacterium]
MPLPDLIEIVPLAGPVTADVTVPGSKSITNRALILAALADGEVRLTGALWSEDTQIMVDALRLLGFEIDVAEDAAEPCNRTLTVQGLGGRVRNAGTAEAPLEIFAGNAGTAARFLGAFVCLANGAVRLSGTERMHERPQGELFHALRRMKYRIDSESNGDDLLPAVFHGTGPREAVCSVSLQHSSQFASALLLSARAGMWIIDVVGDNADEAPYLNMTRELIEAFPHAGGEFEIEPDASSGSYFWGVNCFHEEVEVAHWPLTGWQIDAQFPRFINLPREVAHNTDLGDSIMTAIVLAPLAEHPVSFPALHRLRVQECERVHALRTELTKCGARITEEGDTLHIEPSPELHGAEIDTYNDHRMAMCFAMLGLKISGIRLRNPACVKKTFPNFFQKLASELGAEIRDAEGNVLAGDELFAES